LAQPGGAHGGDDRKNRDEYARGEPSAVLLQGKAEEDFNGLHTVEIAFHPGQISGLCVSDLGEQGIPIFLVKAVKDTGKMLGQPQYDNVRSSQTFQRGMHSHMIIHPAVNEA
jgi:hypothetical protein